jgi:hypothetical protein
VVKTWWPLRLAWQLPYLRLLAPNTSQKTALITTMAAIMTKSNPQLVPGTGICFGVGVGAGEGFSVGVGIVAGISAGGGIGVGVEES